MPSPKTPKLTVDCIIFSKGKVLLVKRKFEPFKGQYALPGGFVEIGETVESACKRELMEETSISASKLRLVGVYSNPKRDPRHHTVTITYMAEAQGQEPKAGDDAKDAAFMDWKNLKLAFDHEQMIKDALRIKQTKWQ